MPYRQNRQTAGRVIDGLAFIVTPTDNKLHTLNSTGTFLWQLAKKEIDVDQAAEALARDFEVDATTAARDAQVCLDDLVEREILGAELASLPRPSPAEAASLYDEAADGYDQRWSEAKTRRFDVIEKPLIQATVGARRVLDIGCGTGRLLDASRGQSSMGIDVSRGMLRIAANKGHQVAVADGHRLPFRDGSFGAIIAGDGVFRYLDYEAAFRECSRVLTQRGRLAIHQYARRTWSLRRTDDHPGHLSAPSELDPAANRAGLKRITDHRWRSIRVPPYVLPIPRWLHAPVWSHCVVVFEK